MIRRELKLALDGKAHPWGFYHWLVFSTLIILFILALYKAHEMHIAARQAAAAESNDNGSDIHSTIIYEYGGYGNSDDNIVTLRENEGLEKMPIRSYGTAS
jgi:hypothetical protein